MFGRSRKSRIQPLAPAPVEMLVSDGPTTRLEDVVGDAREIVAEVLDRLAEQVRDHTIADIVLVLEDLVAELEAYDAVHPDEPFGPEHIDGVLNAICKVRLS